METEDTNKTFPVILPVKHWKALRREGVDTGRSASAIIRDLVAIHLGDLKVKRNGRKAKI
jgi:hypothetical protein